MRPLEVPGLIAVVLEHEMNFAASYAAPDRLAYFADDVGRAFVVNRVHGVEAQSVEMKLLQPVKRVVYEKIAHRPALRAVEINGCAPRRLAAVGEEIASDCRQVIPLGAKVVVDDVEKNGETARVARF